MIAVAKDGVKFTTTGDIGSANVTIRQNTTVDKARRPHPLPRLPRPPPLTLPPAAGLRRRRGL